MTLNLFRTPAVLAFGAMLLASSAQAQTHPAAPQSPYGGVTVEDIIARVNDQIITQSDYDRAMKEMDDEARQKGATLQQISAGHKDLLRSLIDQQLWLSKGKELGINGDTELIQKLNEIRKQYNLETLDDLEKAAKEQGVSFEDFKANIRNSIITQDVMREEVGKRIQFTPGEVQRYYDQHKEDYSQPESVRLSEILVAVPAPADGSAPDDAALATAKGKADDIEAKLHQGGDFTQLAKSFSDGQTASEGGDLGQYKRGMLAKVLEDKTFALNTGQYTEPIRTKQGFVILKVVQHVPGGVQDFKNVEQDVEQAYYMSKMEPAIRDYLTTMREQAYIDIKPGYTDSGASPNKSVYPISYAAYTPPAPKKKKKVERTRYRETTHTFRQKSPQVVAAVDTSKTPPTKKDASLTKAEKPGKKEKIRFGKAPTKTLPSAPNATTEDAGAVQTANAAPEPENPLEANTKPTHKTRYSDRAKVAKPKTTDANGFKVDPQAPAPPDAGEVADRQTQAAPLGLGANTEKSKKKSKANVTTGEKTRLADKNKKPADGTTDSSKPAAPVAQPIPPVPGAPAPATAPAPTTPPAPQP
jgi:peptidyl-prolyl cis-trans isomerase SurA